MPYTQKDSSTGNSEPNLSAILRPAREEHHVEQGDDNSSAGSKRTQQTLEMQSTAQKENHSPSPSAKAKRARVGGSPSAARRNVLGGGAAGASNAGPDAEASTVDRRQARREVAVAIAAAEVVAAQSAAQAAPLQPINTYDLIAAQFLRQHQHDRPHDSFAVASTNGKPNWVNNPISNRICLPAGPIIFSIMPTGTRGYVDYVTHGAKALAFVCRRPDGKIVGTQIHPYQTEANEFLGAETVTEIFLESITIGHRLNKVMGGLSDQIAIIQVPAQSSAQAKLLIDNKLREICNQLLNYIAEKAHKPRGLINYSDLRESSIGFFPNLIFAVVHPDQTVELSNLYTLTHILNLDPNFHLARFEIAEDKLVTHLNLLAQQREKKSVGVAHEDHLGQHLAILSDRDNELATWVSGDEKNPYNSKVVACLSSFDGVKRILFECAMATFIAQPKYTAEIIERAKVIARRFGWKGYPLPKATIAIKIMDLQKLIDAKCELANYFKQYVAKQCFNDPTSVSRVTDEHINTYLENHIDVIFYNHQGRTRAFKPSEIIAALRERKEQFFAGAAASSVVARAAARGAGGGASAAAAQPVAAILPLPPQNFFQPRRVVMLLRRELIEFGQQANSIYIKAHTATISAANDLHGEPSNHVLTTVLSRLIRQHTDLLEHTAELQASVQRFIETNQANSHLAEDAIELNDNLLQLLDTLREYVSGFNLILENDDIPADELETQLCNLQNDLEGSGFGGVESQPVSRMIRV